MKQQRGKNGNELWFDHKCEKKRDDINNSFKGKSSNRQTAE